MDETAAVWKNFDRTGKAEFLKSFKTSFPEGCPLVLDMHGGGGGGGGGGRKKKGGGGGGGAAEKDTNGGKKKKGGKEEWKSGACALHDLFSAAARGQIKREEAVQTLGEMIAFRSDVASLAVDVLSQLDHETSAVAALKDDRERLLALLADAAERFLPEETLKERMEIDTLGEAGVLKNQKKFFTTVIKLKTKLFYKQQKFNLFREECEGYAKLITELNNTELSATTTPKQVLEVVKSIIGYFNLDPNRVLDIILESFECNLNQHGFFIDLLKEYTPDARTLIELLGFKYKFYMTESDVVPSSLFELTALMIQHGIVDLDAIYTMLGPDDKTIAEDADKALADAKETVSKMFVVSTSGKGDKDDDVGYGPKQMLAYKANQKFGLLEALLRVGAWRESELLIGRLPLYFAVSQPPIAKALAQLIHTTMAPIHNKHSGMSARVRSKQYAYAALNNAGAPPPAATYEDFQKTVVPMLLTLGPYAHEEPLLLYKVLRILKTSLGVGSVDESAGKERLPEPVASSVSALYFDALTLMDEVFLPSLALMDGNCCLAEEVWSVLRVYPYHHRYRLYGQWKSELSLHAPTLRKKAAVQKSVKRIMQRVSKENVKQTSRQLGKITHTAPGLVFDYILTQIQVFDNLIGPIVDSLKYLTNLSFDVLGYSIVEALYNPEKTSTKTDGTSFSLWLLSLSNFCGAIFKKYSIELTGILQYVANMLKSKQSLDLIILKEMVLKMGGIEQADVMTNEQIDAMSGGELLRAEAGTFMQVKNVKKSSQRLKDCLIEHSLAIPLCLLMAQQRNCVVYEETDKSHLKLVGKLFDQCQDTLVQFGTFLAANLSIDDYARRFPPMQELLTRYHVNSDLAFFLARPMFNHQINLRFEEMKRADKNWKSRSSSDRQGVHVEAALQVMNPVIASVQPLQSPKIWEDISPQFLTTFWSLTMYDLFLPEKIYEKEIAKLKAAPAKVDENKDMNSSRKKKEKERLEALIEKMKAEQRTQKEHVERVMQRLKNERDNWFLSRNAKTAKNETITSFLQLCLFPRCVFTASDAIYCAKFVNIVHSLRTPNFSTLICFDRIFCDITYTVTCCTENEAHRYGRFLAAMLETVMHWHSAKEIFERECGGYPGFVTKFRVAKVETNESGQAVKKDDNEHVDYENFRHVCHKWHYKIAKALVVCLESKDYVQIRNALTILTKIIPYFPIISNLSGVIEKRIDKVAQDEKENRKDLFIKSMSYSGQLKARKSLMMKESDFHQVKGVKPGQDTPQEKAAAAKAAAEKKAAAAAASNSSDKVKIKSESGSGDKVKIKKDVTAPTEKSRSSSTHDRGSGSRERSEDRINSKSSSSKREREESREKDKYRDKKPPKMEKEEKKHGEHKSSSKDRMGPPHSSSSHRSGSSDHRRSAEPDGDEKEIKRRKTEAS